MEYKCNRCGKRINKTTAKKYTWKDNTYGKECWKIIALPEIEKAKEDAKIRWNLFCRILVEVLKDKDMSKITNEFKRTVIPQLIEQLENEGWMSKKQYWMAYDWLNKKDKQKLYTLQYEADLIEEIKYCYLMHLDCPEKDVDYWYGRVCELDEKTQKEATIND